MLARNLRVGLHEMGRWFVPGLALAPGLAVPPPAGGRRRAGRVTALGVKSRSWTRSGGGSCVTDDDRGRCAPVRITEFVTYSFSHVVHGHETGD